MKPIPAGTLGAMGPFLNAGSYRSKLQAALEIALNRRVVRRPGFNVDDGPRAGLEPLADRESLQALTSLRIFVKYDAWSGGTRMRRIMAWAVRAATAFLNAGGYRLNIRAALESALNRRVAPGPGQAARA